MGLYLSAGQEKESFLLYQFLKGKDDCQSLITLKRLEPETAGSSCSKEKKLFMKI